MTTGLVKYLQQSIPTSTFPKTVRSERKEKVAHRPFCFYVFSTSMMMIKQGQHVSPVDSSKSKVFSY